ncbi:MAG: hypothetical protein A3H88_03820 [Candidatus Blackburnbacteria bacterium RIFCSPLOWO2_02_FULL_44_9]|uniref:Uncharacterized protein n=1 Tax=Candidatus Blackburnbacteria bacterium RIFCSPHIGHO2_02_FULL_44_20 TaxID=1797516 RepID=A0A1G1V5Z7_9BACT|nr:MAG: hypothetical protein A3D26_01395 [Candidatus Blackburnbacteria bacterium RIFCSPHIGHO2_02_FULL_44_20]OGY10856.1 MAG: hypothetical protein A3E16_04165 [Candidatus Blackburnbacteria bacterium RIFCSPHIGHO2_12_FULL_44_25]OGY15267.1 MAG: hypothetical protein A3H88_03820 [Candidatus Blackburnbacteria bacterium RIFCSPLOWO2_02_FULL_44_9]
MIQYLHKLRLAVSKHIFHPPPSRPFEHIIHWLALSTAEGCFQREKREQFRFCQMHIKTNSRKVAEMTIGRNYREIFVDKAQKLVRECEALTGPTSENAHFADVERVHQKIRPLLETLSQMAAEMTSLDKPVSARNLVVEPPVGIVTGVHIENVPGWTRGNVLRGAIYGLTGVYKVDLVAYERGVLSLQVHHDDGLDMARKITGLSGFSLIELDSVGEGDGTVLRFAYLAFQAA